jgi:hypothetical protein
VTYGFSGEPIEGQKTKLGRPARRLIIDEGPAKWVRQIFAWFADEDVCIAGIARRLNAAGAPLPKRDRVTRWTDLIVGRVLDNGRYRGLWQ